MQPPAPRKGPGLPDRRLLRQTSNTIATLTGDYLRKRAVATNELIGKGVVLNPPFRVTATDKGAVTEVTISSATGDFKVECSRVVLSDYRFEIAFVLERNSGPPIIRKLTPLQPARRKMLDVVPPDSSLPTQKFYELTARDGVTQINARRRWGELRTEYRFDTTYDERNFNRGSRVPIDEPAPRPNTGKLMDDNWAYLYGKFEGLCNKCKRKVRVVRTDIDDDGEPGLLDHRRPVPAGGGDEQSNLQVFCAVCNNLKGTACQNCPLNYQCESCTWAHPEKFHDAVVIRLSPENATVLVELAEAAALDPRIFAEQLFREAFNAAINNGSD